MAAGEKKSILKLPLKIILTQEGSTFFIRQNKKLLKFKLADNVEEYGIFLDEFTPATIQRLLLIDYISKLKHQNRSSYLPVRKRWIFQS